jgi:Cof subfamily protein (haloacid dehalogenase superfamily)
MWKIIFSDIDGTLLNKDRNISTETIHAYNRIKTNTDLVLISSRMPSGMTYFQEALNNKHTPLVCYNGGLVLKNSLNAFLNPENILLDISIPFETVRFINDYLKNIEVNFSVYNYNNWYTTKQDYWTAREENNTKSKAAFVASDFFNTHKINAHKINIMGEKSHIDKIYAFLKTEIPTVDLYRAKDTYIEIANKKTSKGLAVEVLLKNFYTTVHKKETIGFGDNYNDIPLFRAVGHAVAVENARSELKAIAHATTLSNKAHGVAAFINENFQF